MLEEPIPATRRVLDRAGMTMKDIDLFEVNEAFASIPLAWMKALDADPERLNVNGGAIALGHPLGAPGTQLMAPLIHAPKARGQRAEERRVGTEWFSTSRIWCWTYL